MVINSEVSVMSKMIKALILSSIGLMSCNGLAQMPSGMPKSYMEECASCHTAYAPRFLNKTNWQNITTDLSHHFGTDATIDDKSLAEIAKWLETNAATQGKSAELSKDNRITSKRWFLHEHDEVSANTWKRASIKGPSNCIACHSKANEGNFNEHDIRIPK